ncbi:MAG: archaellin/type IV pilin N-terminal domain-containing protein, partial [Candidatus Methanofastidiosia archaeon]
MNRKKGVSNIISTILLILITVSLATALYAWITGYVSREQQNLREISAGEVKIEVSILCTPTSCNPQVYRLVIRNIGTDNLSVTNNSGKYLISIYVNGK